MDFVILRSIYLKKTSTCVQTPECTELDCTGGVYKAYFSDKDRKRTKLGRRTTLGFINYLLDQ
jgi:hypothetical protein